MCGNGVRVFAHYLRASGLEARDEFVVGSLAGPRPVTLHHVDATNADVTVDMGKANRLGAGEAVIGGRRFAGMAVDVGNPHLACLDRGTDRRRLAALDVAAPVQFDHAQFPDGVNVEVLTAAVGGLVADAGARTRGGRNPLLRYRNGARPRCAALADAGADTGTLHRASARR